MEMNKQKLSLIFTVCVIALVLTLYMLNRIFPPSGEQYDDKINALRAEYTITEHGDSVILKYSSGETITIPRDILGDHLNKDELYDLGKAKKLLKDSTPLEHPLLISTSAIKSKRWKNLIDAIVGKLSNLGIVAERAFDTIPPSKCQARVEIIKCGVQFEWEFWHSAGRYNLMKYKSSEVDALLDKHVEPNESDIKQLRKLILDDSPAVPLFFLSIPVTYDKRLKATEQKAILSRFLGEIPYWYFENVSLAERRF